jgi:hypothetical protein
MNQQKQNILIIETKNGAKYQGIYISKDLQKQIITLSNVKKTFQQNEETFPMIDIKKDDIASINIIDFRPPKEDIHNINEIPENKKNAIDENQLANVEKAYDKSKDDFFDRLKPMNNPEVKKVSKNYNQKNKDTFNLPSNEDDDDDNKRVWKSRGNKRGNIKNYGRGGYGKGIRGVYNNNNIYKNENNYYYNVNYNKNQGNQNYQGKNYNRGRGFRGRGRGIGRGNRIRYNNNNNKNIENNQDNNNLNKSNESDK